MYTETAIPAAPASGGIASWFRRAEAWLDDRGRGAWIAAMVLGFIFVWPVGLLLLAYMIINGKFGKSRRKDGKETAMFCNRRHHRHHDAGVYRPSGNHAFDSYKAETLRRLEDEQAAFEGFLQRLREAKDKQEFDRFMDDRASAAAAPTEVDDTPRPGAY